MKQEDLDFFKENGYLVIQVLSPDEVGRYLEIFERERRDLARFWTNNGIWQTQYCQSLLTAPELDEIIRHPKIMEPLRALMGGDPCFGQICLNNMGPYDGGPVPAMTTWDGPVGRRWHRDGGHSLMWREHPLRIGYMRQQLYLSDVSDATHGFAISPQSIDDEIINKEAQVEQGGIHDLQGPAGTAVLFNISHLHTVCIRPTQADRKTVGVYYGHRHRDYHSDHTYIPPSLWRDHPDEETRGFYGNLNNLSREYLEQTAGRDEIPLDETMKILEDLPAPKP